MRFRMKQLLYVGLGGLVMLMLPPAVFAQPFAYVTNSGDNTVSVIDTFSNTSVATVGVGRAPVSVAITPDGTRAYVTNFDNTVSVIATSGNTVVATVGVGGGPAGVAIAPDGTRAYVVN
jgi:YVTN family beta-propeller protein